MARGVDRALAAIVLGGLVLRVGYVLSQSGEPVRGDGDGYYWSARLLADGHGFVSSGAFRLSGSEALSAAADHPPAWIVVLAVPALLGFQKVLWFQLTACLVGAATVAAVGVTGRRIAGRRAGLVAAAVAALYPNLWMYERVLQCETLALLVTALGIHATYGFCVSPGPRRAALMGLTCGLLTMTRPEGLLLVPLVALPAIGLRRPTPRPTRLRWSGLALAAALLPIVPWAAYNSARFEQPVVLTTNLGQTLASANCDDMYHDQVGSWSYGCLAEASAKAGDGDASTRDLELRDMAFDYVSEHRGRLPAVVVAREARTWGLSDPFFQLRLDSIGGPTYEVARVGLWAYWALGLLAIAGAVVLRRRRVPLLPLLGVVATVAVSTGLTIGQTRYRALAEVPIVLLAAVALDALRPGQQTPPLPPR